MQCSLTCGSGVRRRNITCSRNTGIDCDPQKKPPAVSACSVQDCPAEVDNFGTDGSGSGWTANDVLNEINSITERRPPSRYSTTRAQPPPGSGVNTIGDFHYHNNIENVDRSPEGSVHFDDFYYDYNFINFHEDLSDDFESDGDGAEGSHTSDTIPQVSAESPEMEKEDANLDPAEDNGRAGAEISEDLDDFLSEDYLLPVSTTRTPPLRHSQTQDGRNNHVSVPAKDANTPEVGNGFDFTADGLPDNADVSATTPEYKTATSGGPTTPTSTPAWNDGVSVDSYYEESTLISEDQKTSQAVQLDEGASEMPHTTSLSFVLPSGFRLEDLDSDHSDFRSTYTTGGHLDLTTASFSTSEESTPSPLPFLQTSGNQQGTGTSTSPGTGTEPPTAVGGATQASPADLLPAVRDSAPTEGPLADGGGAQFSPPAPWFHLHAPDESATPDTATGGRSEPPLSTTAGPEQIPTDPPRRDTPTSTNPSVSLPHSLPTSVQTPASPQATFSGYWITGNWSAVSPPVTLNHSFSSQFFELLFEIIVDFEYN